MSGMFDGLAGRLVARLMAKGNAPAEAEAIDVLSPGPDQTILVIGFGPGVGLRLLAERTPMGRIIGVDPSRVMHSAAIRECGTYIRQGRIELLLGTADSIPIPGSSVDGAIAVNSLQLCDPILDTARELARVMKSGSRLVSLTHDWAAASHAGTAAEWIRRTTAAFGAAGFSAMNSRPANAEKGRSIIFEARRQD